MFHINSKTAKRKKCLKSFSRLKKLSQLSQRNQKIMTLRPPGVKTLCDVVKV